ncbi:MAG: alpha-amylase family protein [Clostridiales bacterium]|nr:alpha-amylase family protein [Clostridiales bacterium]
MWEARTLFDRRLQKHRYELRWLYMELYDNGSMFTELCDRMEQFYLERDAKLRDRDHVREAEAEAGSAWYKGNDLLGMMLYVDNFAGTLKGVEERLDYIQKCNVNVLHLMPFLKTEKGKSDGGYAVSDFRRVNDELGTMEDLAHLANTCHENGINVCMDFVMNHTSECHEWARRARAGEGEYMSRYFFYENETIPRQFEQTVPQVFPTTAPGNFTWLPQIGHYVMTTFYPYQWDLNYRNPRVFNEMMYNFLYLANQGIDIFRIDAVPYIWKELGTPCRNLRQVHTIVRMMRMIAEIVCPGILLLGEVVMEPEKVAPYFGTIEKPECHMLYNVTTMATTWHTVATRDVRLLKKQLDTICALPKDYVFLNYLRCHDDIGWGLDYDFLARQGFEECAHKQYLKAYFLGKAGNSSSRGELYNDDPVTGDARFCGTTASMCGIEAAERRLREGCPKEETEIAQAISLDVMLHAYMFFLSGIPILYSGDEVAQKNDYSYREDPWKMDDSRYIHRGRMDWEAVERLKDADSTESRVFYTLARLEEIRRTSKVFVTNADVWTVETGDDSVLGIGRCFEGEKVVGLFNFCENDKTAWISETDGMYEDLLSGERMQMVNVKLPAYGFRYLQRCAC